MKTVTEMKTIYASEVCNIENLIEKLNEIRRSTNATIGVEMYGDLNYGYKLQLRWERPMTEEEAKRAEEYHAKAEVAAKEYRRQQYEKLKAEFETE